MNASLGIQGNADPAFASCLEAFRANFEPGGELGAACAIFRDGRPVLTAWGGVAVEASHEPWQRNTAVPVFSVTKGVAALCVLSQVSRGLLDLDRPVSHYWPEFAACGKAKVTVREALGHRAGVPAVSGTVTIEDLRNIGSMTSRLASEQPWFEPGSSHVYHPITIGWITTELVRRTTGSYVGEWLQREAATPLALNVRIGGPNDLRSPVAQVDVPSTRDTPELDPRGIPGCTLSLNGLFVPRLSGMAAAVNDPLFRSPEMAGFNGIADAESLAKFYAAAIGHDRGGSLISPQVASDASQVVSEGCMWGMDMPGPTWGAGVMLPWEVQPMLGEGSFGHDGAGGSLAFAHPPSGISFAYVRNRFGVPGVRDPLVYRVVNALADCLGITLPYR